MNIEQVFYLNNLYKCSKTSTCQSLIINIGFVCLDLATTEGEGAPPTGPCPGTERTPGSPSVTRERRRKSAAAEADPKDVKMSWIMKIEDFPHTDKISLSFEYYKNPLIFR